MRRALVLSLLLAAGTAHAHGVGTSQIRLRVDGARIEGTWEIHLGDARLALGLDPQVAGEAGWLELRRREAELRGHLEGRIALAADSAACPLAVSDVALGWDPATAVVRVPLASTCPRAPARLTLRCDLLFERDPAHRVYFSVEDARVVSVGVLRNDLRSATFDVRQFDAAAIVVEFVREGIWHIWAGLDHLLFLLALLLPAPLVRSGGAWSPRPGAWPAAGEAVKVVTAFTVAHSITLALAFFGIVTLPAHAVESAIALSVFAAAWNNLRPFLPGRAWTMALAFGLVHGLGFAGALRNLALPRRAGALALGAFNVGVELGQLVLVAAALPLLIAAARRGWYPRLGMGVGSLAIAWMAAVWFLERAFGWTLLPR